MRSTAAWVLANSIKYLNDNPAGRGRRALDAGWVARLAAHDQRAACRERSRSRDCRAFSLTCVSLTCGLK